MKPGDYVVFAPLAKSAKPSPLRVTEVLSNGMIRLDRWAGYFKAYLFVVVESPEEEKRSA
jgi:hypothetical protein